MADWLKKHRWFEPELPAYSQRRVVETLPS
jgi:hypothetical protein